MKNSSTEAKQHFSEAKKCISEGDFSTAVEHLQKAGQEKPALKGIKPYLGLALVAIEHFEDAILVLEEALEENLRNKELYFLLGNIYAKKKMHLLACVTFKRGLSFFPNDAEMHFRLGELRYEMDYFELAFCHLQAALRLPSNLTRGQLARVHHYLGQIYYNEGHYPKSSFHWEQAESLLPGTYDNLLGLTSVYFMLRDDEKHGKYFGEMLQHFPEKIFMRTEKIQ